MKCCSSSGPNAAEEGAPGSGLRLERDLIMSASSVTVPVSAPTCSCKSLIVVSSGMRSSASVLRCLRLYHASGRSAGPAAAAYCCGMTPGSLRRSIPADLLLRYLRGIGLSDLESISYTAHAYSLHRVTAQQYMAETFALFDAGRQDAWGRLFWRSLRLLHLAQEGHGPAAVEAHWPHLTHHQHRAAALRALRWPVSHVGPTAMLLSWL